MLLFESIRATVAFLKPRPSDVSALPSTVTCVADGANVEKICGLMLAGTPRQTVTSGV